MSYTDQENYLPEDNIDYVPIEDCEVIRYGSTPRIVSKTEWEKRMEAIRTLSKNLENTLD
ncbi:MAG: hypothetical protein KJ767_02465 [Nanoarchaeota archaeon]|nr:hypothetical protein [Nanoarchaeota archaeon]